VDFAEELGIVGIARRDEIGAIFRHEFLLALQVESFAPVVSERAEQAKGIASRLGEQAIQPDGTQAGEGVENDESLLFGQFFGHACILASRQRA